MRAGPGGWERARQLIPRIGTLLIALARASWQAEVEGERRIAREFSGRAQYALFMFPPPETCFPDAAAVYAATAVSDGLFADPRVRRDGIRVHLRINDFDLGTAVWDSSSGLEADEGLAHHFSIPGLPDGEYEAELSILLGADGDEQVGLPAATSFIVDHAGECASDPADTGGADSGVPRDGSAGGRSTQEPVQILVNVARGKRAWMSSTAEGSPASHASDGLTMVTSLVQRNALTAENQPPMPTLSSEKGGFSKAESDAQGESACDEGQCSGQADSEVFWEVDLGKAYEIHLVDLWAGRQAAAAGTYPPIVALQSSLAPLDMTLLAPDWSPVAAWRLTADGSAGSRGQPHQHATADADFMGRADETGRAGGDGAQGQRGHGFVSWRVGGAGAESAGIWARYLRVSAPAWYTPDEQGTLDGGDAGRGRRRRRQLALLEVAVFARETWNCTRHCEEAGRGRCAPLQPLRTSGPCECAPDRVGVDCSGQLLTDFAFLPPALSAPARLEPARWRGEVLQQAVREVEAAQQGGSCSSPDAMVVGYHPGGMAASLSLIASILSMALSLNRTMLLWRKAEWFYADPTECPDRQMSCFFVPWHQCEARHVDSFLEGAFHVKVEESSTTRGVQPFAWVPPAHKDKGIFWWRTVLNRFLFRLAPKMAEELDIDGALQQLGLHGERFIGVHVRLGDSCVKWQELFRGHCIPASEHIAHTRFMAWRYGIRRVFVASDDPSVPAQFVRALPELSVVSADTLDRYRQVLHDMEKSKREWTENRLRTGMIERGELLRSTLLDVELLSRAAVFVGHLASNLSRLAYSLAVGSAGGIVPFISVDGPWCYHWQLCCDVDDTGRSNMCS